MNERVSKLSSEDGDQAFEVGMWVAQNVARMIPTLIEMRLGQPRDADDVRHIAAITLCTAYLASRGENAAKTADNEGLVYENWLALREGFNAEAENEEETDRLRMVQEAAELLRCSGDEALWGIEAACVTLAEWADDTAREGALARIRGAFEELDSGQAEGPETSPSVSPASDLEDGDTNHPRTDGGTDQPTTDRFTSTSDGMTCNHEWHEAVDGEGKLIEPAQDVCVQCGEVRL